MKSKIGCYPISVPFFLGEGRVEGKGEREKDKISSIFLVFFNKKSLSTSMFFLGGGEE